MTFGSPIRTSTLAFALLLTACGDDAPVPDMGSDAGCASAADCDDGVYCNGAEQCVAGLCAAGEEPCGADERCSEESSRCVTGCEDPDMDGDGVDAMSCGGDDCDDTDPDVYPGAVEVCDVEGKDEDCDPTTVGPDRDGDGFAPLTCCNGDTCGVDCNDFSRATAPGGLEACNLMDDDCDGRVDEGVTGPGYMDADGDRRGAEDGEILGCPSTPGFSYVGDDCDDTDPNTPGAEIIGDLADNDCDGRIDEGDGSVLRPWWPDTDGDGFGDPAGTTIDSAAPLTGYAPVAGDCAPSDPMIHPGAEERCNGIDDDCNGLLDGEDDDGDGVPDAACSPTGDADCDDENPEVYPGAPEICDGTDNDCDESTPTDITCATQTWYPDTDGDGFGTGTPVTSTSPVDGHASRAGDCDDTDPVVYPLALELCDGVDQDCDTVVDESSDLSCGGPHMGGFCVSGSCSTFCEIGWGDCDASMTNGCEIDLTQPSNCGECGNACPSGANGVPACIDFECDFTCAGSFRDCNGDVTTDGCEVNTLADESNCGGCGIGCRDAADTVATCLAGACTYECATGYSDCDGDLADASPVTWCEIRSDRDVDNCGACGMMCGGAEACITGACQGAPYPSTGAEGAYAPTLADAVDGVVTLSPGVHDFTTIDIPAGITVVTSGSGILDLRATGDVTIAGVIDLSGSRGGNDDGNDSGGGGATGTPMAPGADDNGDGVSQCGGPGGGGTGVAGGNGEVNNAACGLGGVFGGGAGGNYQFQAGGGGGGYAGGGGGMSSTRAVGGDGAAATGETAAAGGYEDMSGTCFPPEGGVAPGAYAGETPTNCALGAGGSIGAVAAADLAVMSTFRPGSAGGGGGGGWPGGNNGAGGGGAGGALRIATPTRLELAASGALLANGGRGGTAGSEGRSGGGGSGGVIVLSAPAMRLNGPVSVLGGRGGGSMGASGGLGRIRLSVREEDCSIAGAMSPAPVAECAPANMSERPYVARYPN